MIRLSCLTLFSALSLILPIRYSHLESRTRNSVRLLLTFFNSHKLHPLGWRLGRYRIQWPGIGKIPFIKGLVASYVVHCVTYKRPTNRLLNPKVLKDFKHKEHDLDGLRRQKPVPRHRVNGAISSQL